MTTPTPTPTVESYLLYSGQSDCDITDVPCKEFYTLNDDTMKCGSTPPGEVCSYNYKDETVSVTCYDTKPKDVECHYPWQTPASAPVFPEPKIVSSSDGVTFDTEDDSGWSEAAGNFFLLTLNYQNCQNYTESRTSDPADPGPGIGSIPFGGVNNEIPFPTQSQAAGSRIADLNPIVVFKSRSDNPDLDLPAHKYTNDYQFNDDGTCKSFFLKDQLATVGQTHLLPSYSNWYNLGYDAVLSFTNFNQDLSDKSTSTYVYDFPLYASTSDSSKMYYLRVYLKIDIDYELIYTAPQKDQLPLCSPTQTPLPS